ncbi:alpha/beta fold hydrolase [Streptomyces sp. NBC_00669]|uniref:thioesterase II family protein n=1 Tax=unclassified Streptomyces TaxID=2593676 RepID=UPI002E2F0E3A|nr:alpha/beta fold hydrolase [Streptomyces sp. NBC_00669]
MPVTPVDSGTWIRRFHPVPEPAPRLVCFPHAGGSASYFFPVSRALAPRVEVLAVQYPGRQDRRTDPLIDDAEQLADRVTAALGPWTDRPLTFFGHSLGAVVAFEVARRLQDAGRPVDGLIASGRRAPSRFREERVHLGTDAQVRDELSRLNGTDARVLADRELLASLLPAVRSDYKAVETYRYRPGPALGCPLLVLTGADDPHVTADEAEAWREHTTGPYEVRVYPGGHFFLTTHATAVTELIAARITRSERDNAP